MKTIKQFDTQLCLLCLSVCSRRVVVHRPTNRDELRSTREEERRVSVCVFAESWEGATKSELAAIGREAEVR